jgi:hypothetical protein
MLVIDRMLVLAGSLAQLVLVGYVYQPPNRILRALVTNHRLLLVRASRGHCPRVRGQEGGRSCLCCLLFARLKRQNGAKVRFLRREKNQAAVRDFCETTSASIRLRRRICPADGIKETTNLSQATQRTKVQYRTRMEVREEVANMLPNEQGGLYEAARSVSAPRPSSLLVCHLKVILILAAGVQGSEVVGWCRVCQRRAAETGARSSPRADVPQIINSNRLQAFDRLLDVVLAHHLPLQFQCQS